MEAGQGAGNQGRGKDISTIVNAEKEEEETATVQALETRETQKIPSVVPVQEKVKKESDGSEEEDSEEELRVVPKQRGKGNRKKHRKLNQLDIDSADDTESDEDFKGDRYNFNT